MSDDRLDVTEFCPLCGVAHDTWPATPPAFVPWEEVRPALDDPLDPGHGWALARWLADHIGAMADRPDRDAWIGEAIIAAATAQTVLVHALWMLCEIEDDE